MYVIPALNSFPFLLPQILAVKSVPISVATPTSGGFNRRLANAGSASGQGAGGGSNGPVSFTIIKQEAVTPTSGSAGANKHLQMADYSHTPGQQTTYRLLKAPTSSTSGSALSSSAKLLSSGGGQTTYLTPSSSNRPSSISLGSSGGNGTATGSTKVSFFVKNLLDLVSQTLDNYSYESDCYQISEYLGLYKSG